MNSLPPSSPFIPCASCQAAVSRLVGNISGFVYRRRNDADWTMEYVSEACRDVIGYDPHRFIDNASIAFADLIAPADRNRVNERLRVATLLGQPARVEYRIRTAYGTRLLVEDRFTPVVDATGRVLAIEGIIDRTATGNAETWILPRVLPDGNLADLRPSLRQGDPS